MRRRLRETATYSNVMATIAVFIALGAGAYAAGLPRDSVKAKQIKAGAVRSSELAGNAVTSDKVENGSLLGADFAAGQLPAGPEGPAGSPDTPQQVLDKLKEVDGGGSGLDSDTVGGSTAASLKDGCPATMNKIGSLLCINKTAGGPTSWGNAVVNCASKNLRLPTPDELYLVWTNAMLASGAFYWTNSVGGPAGAPVAQAVTVDGTDGSGDSVGVGRTDTFFACVMAPTDG
jgi:hypothetical protein